VIKVIALGIGLFLVTILMMLLYSVCEHMP
jgi:hypothetical protein